MSKNETRRLEIHELFASYLRAKIDQGVFPQGCVLPAPSDFMMIFRLGFSDIVKASVSLEKRGLVKGEGNSRLIVAAGRSSGKPGRLDVRADVNRLFGDLESLERKALDNAWPRIDREAIRRSFNQNKGESHSQRIWRLNVEINKQIIGNCSDVDLCLRLAAIQEEIEFFRLLYLESIPQNELLAHATSLESIVKAIVSCKQEEAQFQISSYIAHIQEKLLNVFKDSHPIACESSREPLGKSSAKLSETVVQKTPSQISADEILEMKEGEPKMASLEESNLKRLAKTALLMNFVKSKKGNWNHQDWLQFLSDIKRRGFNPIAQDQVGLLLEEKKSQYLAASSAPTQ